MIKKLKNLVLGSPLLALLSGCPAVTPYVLPTVICAGEQISQAIVKQIWGDVSSKNWSDLEAVAKQIGYGTLSCVLDQVMANDASLKSNVGEFRSMHAAEFRAAGVGQ